MSEDTWTEEMTRTYVAGMENSVKHDHRPWASEIAKRIPESNVVLEVGAGPAFLTVELAPLLKNTTKLIATDFSATMMTIASERAKKAGVDIATCTCRGESLDQESESVDTVVMKHFYRLCDNKTGAITEALRVLRPGGTLVIIDFNADASFIKPLALRFWLLVTGGSNMSRLFWKSFSETALHADQVPSEIEKSGFVDAEVVIHGLSFMLLARKPTTKSPHHSEE